MHEALGDGQGAASRLEAVTDELHLYTLHAEHLSLHERLAKPSGIYQHKTVAAWREAVSGAFSGAYWWRIEAGAEGRLHVHVIADKSAGPVDLVRGGECCKPVYDLPGLLRYLAKPVVLPSHEALAVYRKAKARVRRQGKQLPRTSGYVGIPSSKNWQNGTIG
jgi:hypothetical protein